MRYLSLSLLLLIIIPFLQPAFGADWYDSNWLKARSITIDGADIDTANLANYPLYVNITSLDVGTVTQADCDDIVFTNYQNTTKFSHEIENCDGTANWIEAWVRVPTVYNANNTKFFMYYDNAGASDQQSTQATWNSDYQFVAHVNGTFIDSTSSPITCTNSGSSAVTDEYMGDSRNFDFVDDYIDCGSASKLDQLFSTDGSISAWINPNSDGENGGVSDGGRIMSKRSLATGTPGWDWVIADESGTNEDFQFYVMGASSSERSEWQTTNREVQESTWNYVTVTWVGSSTATTPIFYVDGVSVAITVNFDNSASFQSDAGNNLCLGNFGATANCSTIRTFDGKIDEFRMNDEILTAQWIKADWECQRGAVDGNSCITVGNEGEEAGGADHPQSYADTLALTDTLVFTGTGAQVYSDTLAITDTLVFTGEGSQTYTDTLAITDDLVFIYNDLNPDFTDTLDLTDTYTQLCTGTCGVTPTPNAIILSVNKSPFIMGVYSDATRMTCSSSIQGGVIFNTTDLNLNICDGTNWILPDGTIT